MSYSFIHSFTHSFVHSIIHSRIYIAPLKGNNYSEILCLSSKGTQINGIFYGPLQCWNSFQANMSHLGFTAFHCSTWTDPREIASSFVSLRQQREKNLARQVKTQTERTIQQRRMVHVQHCT